MTQVTLPSGSNITGPNLWSQVYGNDNALREVVNGGLDNENLSGSAGITAAKLASNAKPVTWYTPKIIATEESRENTAFGTLTTKDEIAEVVLPTNGLIVIGYSCNMKCSVAGAGKAAIFIGANQLKTAEESGTAPVVQETSPSTTNFTHVVTAAPGLTKGSGTWSGDVTTGQTLNAGIIGGPCYVFAAAGTYAISVQYKATSGSITAKERKLWVEVHGY